MNLFQDLKIRSLSFNLFPCSFDLNNDIDWKILLRIRLIAVSYPLFVFSNKYSSTYEEEVLAFFNIATGVAISSIHNADREYSKEEASEISSITIGSVFKFLKNEFKTGPSKPSKGEFTSGLLSISEIVMSSIFEVIGENENKVDLSSKLNLPITGGIISSLSHTTKHLGNPN